MIPAIWHLEKGKTLEPVKRQYCPVRQIKRESRGLEASETSLNLMVNAHPYSCILTHSMNTAKSGCRLGDSARV